MIYISNKKKLKIERNTKHKTHITNKTVNYFLLLVYRYTKLQAILYKNTINMLFSMI